MTLYVKQGKKHHVKTQGNKVPRNRSECSNIRAELIFALTDACICICICMKTYYGMN